MKVILLTIYIIMILLILYDSIFTNFRVWKQSNIHSEIQTASQEIRYKIVIFLAVYNAGKAVYDFLDWMSKLEYHERVSIVVVSSAREEGSDKVGTSEYWIEKAKKDIKIDIKHIRCPYLYGNKTTQLNYALHILKNKINAENSYIGIYDVDSRPDTRTFKELFNILYLGYKKKKKINVIQQTSKYFLNMEDSSILMKLEGILLTRRSLGIELSNYEKSILNKGIPYTYCVGHGMFIYAKFFRDEYDWKLLEPHEDVAFGIQMALRGIPVYPMRTMDDAEVAPNVTQLRRQAGKWFINCFIVLKVILKEKNNGIRFKSRKIVLLIKSTIDMLSWMHYSIALTMALILCIYYKYSYIIMVGTVLLFWLDSGVGTLLIFHAFSKELKSLTLKDRMALFLLAPIREFLRSMGVIQFIVYLIRSCIYKEKIINIIPVTKEKTD